MELYEVLSPNRISFDVDLKNKDEVFRYLSKQLYDQGVIDNVDIFIKALYYRENLSETGLEKGVAIPHGKDNSVLKSGIAFVRLKKPIEWESIDGNPVKLIFLLAIPTSEESNQNHLKILSDLSRSLIKDDTIKKLYNINTTKELFKIFERKEEK